MRRQPHTVADILDKLITDYKKKESKLSESNLLSQNALRNKIGALLIARKNINNDPLYYEKKPREREEIMETLNINRGKFSSKAGTKFFESYDKIINREMSEKQKLLHIVPPHCLYQK